MEVKTGLVPHGAQLAAEHAGTRERLSGGRV